MEVNIIPDIREQPDRRKDKHEKRPAVSTAQRQMVQKFVKEVNDSAKQPDCAASVESAAAEQVEAAACEIVREAVQLPRTTSLRNISSDCSQTEQSAPRQAPDLPRQRSVDAKFRSKSERLQNVPVLAPQEQGRRAYLRKAKKMRTEKQSVRGDSHAVQSEIRFTDGLSQRKTLQTRKEAELPESCSQAPDEQKHVLLPSVAASAEAKPVRYIKQPGSWTPRIVAAPDVRSHEHPIREQMAADPVNVPMPTPQAQMRRAFAKSQARRVQSPSINPSEQAVSILQQPPVSEALAPPQAPSAKSLPAIRERTNRNAAPKEKPRSGVAIRTRETVPPDARKVQPAPSVSGTAAKRARKAATQDAKRKMLKKSNSRTARATAAAAKRLAEATAKAGKELIGALAGLGGGVALLVVFCVLIVAGALLASPLGILFADEQKNADTVPLATAIAEIQGEYHAKLEELQIGDLASVQIVGQAPDWCEVVAVFASKTAGSEDGIDVFTLDAARVELLRQVFWDMCQISTQTEPTQNEAGEAETALTITISAKTAEQMRLEYAFSKYQNDALDLLLENLGSLHIPMGSLTISQEDAIALLENLPGDLDPARKAVVETALQLVGKVSYFWGGKSLVLGWDDRWGMPMEVTAAGSGSTGTVRPFGLDCSGFVDWVFYNATNGVYYPGHGGGAATQHSDCENIPWSEAQPGDLVFYPDDSHVGIVGGTDADGNLLIIHCSGGANGVVITGAAGFTAVAKPECFTQ